MGQSTFAQISFLLIPIADLNFQLDLEGAQANSLIGASLFLFTPCIYVYRHVRR